MCCYHFGLPCFSDTGVAYHTLTFGLYADQLVRRLDKKRRGLAQFFREEIGDKFSTCRARLSLIVVIVVVFVVV